MATDGPEIARAYVTIMPSMQGVGKSINKEFGGAGIGGAAAFSGGMLSGLKGFAGTLLATVGIGVISDGFKSLVAEASSLNEANNALNVTYGETAAQLFSIRESSADLFGLSKLDFSNAAVQMSAFSKTIGGDAGAASAFESIVGRATDFASVMNLEVSDALALFQSGLAGETEPLRRYGIDLSAAATEAFALANGIGDGTGNLTEAEKVQARYGALLAQTAATQGDFANTSDELANSQRILGASWTDAKAQLGEALLPVALKFTEFLQMTIPYVESFAGWASDLAGRFQGVSGELSNANGAFGPFRQILATVGDIFNTQIRPAVTDFVDRFKRDLMPVILDTVDSIKSNLLPYLQKLSDFFVKYIAPVLKFVVGLWVEWAKILITYVWPTLIKVVGWLYSVLLPVMSALVDGIAAVIDWFGWLGGKIGEVAGVVVARWQSVLEFFAPLWDAISLVFAVAWDFITDLFKMSPIGKIIENWDAISTYFRNVFETIKGLAGQAWQWILDKLADSPLGPIVENWDAIVAYFKEVPGKIAGAFSSLKDSLMVPFKAAFNAIATGWNNTVGKLSFTVPDWVEDLPGGSPLAGKSWSIPKIPLLDTGGIVMSPTLAMVGERRPEAVIPLEELDKWVGGTGLGNAQISIYGIQDVDQIAAELPRLQYRGAA